MKTITEHSVQTWRIKGSRFIGYLFPVSSPEEFDEQFGNVKSSHPSATHHCYAWRIGSVQPEEFVQDNGEPSGTAGLPILNQLKSFDLLNTGLVVVRYYGGTKLGKAGLIEAYGHTAELCIKSASLQTLLPTRLFEIRYPYEQQNLIDKWKNSFQLIEKNAEYLEEVTVRFACPVDLLGPFKQELQNSGHLLTFFEELGNTYELI